MEISDFPLSPGCKARASLLSLRRLGYWVFSRDLARAAGGGGCRGGSLRETARYRFGAPQL